MRKIIQLSLLALLISACTLEKSKKSSAYHRMEELNDSLSYAIGLDMGMRMELEYKDINHKMLNKGIDDYFSKNEYNLTDKERFRIIKKYTEETQPKYRMALEKNNMIEGKKFLEQNLKNEGVKMFQVKTISEESDCKFYAKTRQFYKSVGFIPLEVFPKLWDESNPCLQLVKQI